MKKIILILAVALTSFAQTTEAQTGQIRFTGSDATTDTVTDAGTVYLTSEDLTGKGYTSYDVQIPFTNISGTSTFKVIKQCTLDGSNWTNMNQVAGTDGIGGADTLQVTSLVPPNWIFRDHPNQIRSITSSTFLHTNSGMCMKIRYKVIGAGTGVTKIGPAKGYGTKSE